MIFWGPHYGNVPYYKVFKKKYPLLLNLVEKSASRQLQSQPVLKNAKIAIFGILGQFWGFHNFFVGTSF